MQALADTLRAEVRDGKWPKEEIRTLTALRTQYGVPEYLAAEAIKLLKAEAIVETRRKVGVRPKATGVSWGAPDGERQTVHIERTIRQRITAGTYRPGTFLPTLAVLAIEFGVSPSVVSDALKPLRDERLLSLRPFAGTVVTGPHGPCPVASQPTA
ncbi:GntR family transcriptional regulator [Streptomyces chartreusis]